MAKSNTWPGRYGFDHVICPPFLSMLLCPGCIGGNHPTEWPAGAIRPAAPPRLAQSGLPRSEAKWGLGATNSSERGLTPM